MTDDIMVQAEVLLKNQPKWRILASEDAEDVKSLIELMPQLLAEAKRQKALNPFQVDVSTAMRLGDNEFVYGDKKSLDLCENRIRDRDAWKAEAIEERAIQKSGFMNDVLDEIRDVWAHDITETAKDWARGEAARELEEEMKHDYKGRPILEDNRLSQ